MVFNGNIHVHLPADFTAIRVELMILSVDDHDTASDDFQHKDKTLLYRLTTGARSRALSPYPGTPGR